MTSEPHLQNQAPQYSVASLVLATAIGTLFAAAALLALNCKRLTWPGQAAVVVAVLVLAGCVELWAIWVSPGDLISQLLSHTLFAVVAAYLLLRADLPDFFGPMISRRMPLRPRGAHEKVPTHRRADGRRAARG
jgi:hypothetical protein